MRFQKGQSGNPGGRPREHGDLREMARAHTPTALATLIEICETGKNESARVAAANAILDRGHGKPTQALEHRTPRDELRERVLAMSREERRAWMLDVAERARLTIEHERLEGSFPSGTPVQRRNGSGVLR